MNTKAILAACAALAISFGCGQSHKPTLFVAASLADVAAAWQAGYGGGFDYHAGASHLLAQQIRSGAGADLFVAAGPTAVTPLLEAGLVERIDSNYLHNRLVLVCAPGVRPPWQLSELLDPRFARIAVADPELAPAGTYARAGLEKAGLWNDPLPRILFTGDVRMAVETVRLATADAAFVYATDVGSAGDATVVALDSTLFPRASYPLVMLSPLTPAKDALWLYLHSDAARQMAESRGFK